MSYNRARRLTIIFVSVGIGFWLGGNLLGMLAIECAVVFVLSVLWPEESKQHSERKS